MVFWKVGWSWWCGSYGEGGMGVIVKEELCEKVVEVTMVSDRVMAFVLVFEEDVLRLTCGYISKVEEAWNKNILFMMS